MFKFIPYIQDVMYWQEIFLPLLGGVLKVNNAPEWNTRQLAVSSRNSPPAGEDGSVHLANEKRLPCAELGAEAGGDSGCWHTSATERET